MSSELTLHNALIRARRLDQAHRNTDAVALLQQALAETAVPHSSALLHEVVFLLAEFYNASWEPKRVLNDLLAQWDLVETRHGQCELAWADYRETGTTDPRRLEALLQDASLTGTRTQLRSMLVAGKILAEQSALESARSWLLRGMSAAREQLDDEMLAAFAGALGEVFYLGGDVLTALELFDLDTGLLPPGSRDVERLAIYRAHCYRQLDENDAARTLYNIARMRSELREEASPFALRGLLWCAVIDKNTADVTLWLQALRNTDDAHSLALGLLGVASTLPPKERTSLLSDAEKLLEQEGYWRELAWVRSAPFPNPLFGGKTLDTPVHADELSACDRELAQLPLEAPQNIYNESARAFNEAEPPTGWMRAFF